VTTKYKLSEAELEAVHNLELRGGSMIVDEIPPKSDRGFFGDPVPGIPIYKKLAKKQIVFFTEEDEVDLGDDIKFKFADEVYLEADYKDKIENVRY
jgi:hypothetical protein